jgi:hypothetical protein
VGEASAIQTMHRITRTLNDGDTQYRDFDNEAEASHCFDCLTIRQDVTRVVWHEGWVSNEEIKQGSLRLVRWANAL